MAEQESPLTGQKHAGGRPLRFASPEDLQQTFQDWKLEFQEGGRYVGEIPDVECFCDYIDSYRNLLNEYESKKEFSGTIKEIKNWIYYRKKQLAMQNKMPVAMFIFDAVNNAGYTNKTVEENTGEQTLTIKHTRG